MRSDHSQTVDREIDSTPVSTPGVLLDRYTFTYLYHRYLKTVLRVSCLYNISLLHVTSFDANNFLSAMLEDKLTAGLRRGRLVRRRSKVATSIQDSMHTDRGSISRTAETTNAYITVLVHCPPTWRLAMVAKEVEPLIDFVQRVLYPLASLMLGFH